jgi:WD40 repeat protein
VFTRLTNDPSQYVGLSLTADRDRLVSSRSGASFSIWTSDAAAIEWSQALPTTPQKGPIGFGVEWLGEDLIFPSMASGNWVLERWRASTRRTEMIAAAAGAPQVTSDGAIVFFDYDRGVLFKADANGRNTVQLNGFNPSMRVTPDGQQITSIDAVTGTLAVRIRPIDNTGEARVITAEGVRGGSALVSPDGRKVAYTSFDDQKRPATTVCDVDACTAKQTFPITALEWAPDGRGLAYLDARASADVWIQPIDGAPASQLTHFPEDGQQIWAVAWSADGQRIAVARASVKNDIVLFRGLKPAAR